MSAQSPQQASQSQASFAPVASTSQESSICTYRCQWAWCRSTFHNDGELKHHVVEEHVYRAIPVRRRDIPLLRRAEDGSGESLTFSYAFTGQSSNSAATKPNVSSSNEYQQDVAHPSMHNPSSSLPSPPTSSLAGFSPASNHRPLVGDIQSSGISPHTDIEGYSDARPEPGTPPAQKLVEDVNSFGSLSSPAGSATSFAIPDIPNSPSFSSLIEKSTKRKLVFGAPGDSGPRKDRKIDRHPLSQSTNSSTGSHASVEQQLTQSLDSEDDSSGSKDGLSEEQSSNDEDSIHGPSRIDEDAYISELQWHRSQHETLESLESQAPNFTQGSEYEAANFDILSQAPSQFQTDSFPFHYHGPKASTSSQIEPKPTASLHLSSPAPLPSPKYATSTPQKQNWYQAHIVQLGTKVEISNPDKEYSTPSPMKSQRTHSRSSSRIGLNSSKSKKFTSGTLQILPAAHGRGTITEEPASCVEDLMDLDALPQNMINSQSQSQSCTDSSQSLDDFSYPPLQTQAPYQSQSMSQF